MSTRVRCQNRLPEARPTTCGWLVRVRSGDPEPSCEADCWREVECGEPVGSGRHALCPDHQAVMDMPDLEFEAVYERD